MKLLLWCNSCIAVCVLEEMCSNYKMSVKIMTLCGIVHMHDVCHTVVTLISQEHYTDPMLLLE